MCTRMQNDHLRTLTICSPCQNSVDYGEGGKKAQKKKKKKACTKSVRAFRVLKLDTTRKKKKKNESKKLHQ